MRKKSENNCRGALTFDNFFSRADEEVLQKLLGKDELNLIMLLNEANISLASLKALVIEKYGSETLLLDKKSRNLLLVLLKPHEADKLIKHLEIGNRGDSYEALKNAHFNNQTKLNLLSFFGLNIPKMDTQPEVEETQFVNANYSLFDHQIKVVKDVQNSLTPENRRLMIHMPTGSGKTRTTMNVICEFLRNNSPALIIWLVYNPLHP